MGKFVINNMKSVSMCVVILLVDVMTSLALECYDCQYFKAGEISESGRDCEVALNVLILIYSVIKVV